MKKFTTKEIVRGCQCNISEIEKTPDFHYCPCCGKQMWKNREKSSIAYDKELGYDAFYGLQVFYNEYDDYVIVAGEHASIADCDGITLFDSIDPRIVDNVVKARVKQVLEPHGLWSEEEFAVWPYLQAT